MIYVRGNRRDYDQWRDLGNPGWGFDDVLNYFKKSEANKVEYIVDQTKGFYHGTNGYLSVDNFNSIETLKTVVYEAAFELGYRELQDIHAEEHIGFVTTQGTLQNGERCSTAKAFLNTIKNRKNLHIIKHALVTKLIVENKQVKGVNFILGEKEMSATVRKEVIVSAGSVQTPKILMSSGIGPKVHLESLKIPINLDAPVGENLQDHVIVPIFLRFHKSRAEAQDPKEIVDDLFSFLRYRVGKFSATGSTDLLGFVNTVNETDKYPDLQYHFFSLQKQTLGLKEVLDKFGFADEYLEQIYQANSEGNILEVVPSLLNPKSRGKIVLKSRDPLEYPKIIANYLEEQEDVNTLVRGIKNFRRFLKTKNFEMHEAEDVRIKIKECDELVYDSDEYWECYVRYFSTTLYHPVGK